MRNIIFKSILLGILGATLLLIFYFFTLSIISGKNFAFSQFNTYWYFIVSLAVGFGIQIGLYVYLKNAVHCQEGSGKVLVISGTTSTVAMISCCSHYLVNIIPVIGAAGIISLIGRYQIEFFWVGLVFNIIGIIYTGQKIIKFKQI